MSDPDYPTWRSEVELLNERSGRHRLFKWAAGVALVVVALVILLPARPGRVGGRREYCRNNLKQIAIALYNYHDANGCFPPAFTADDEGRPMHSWRVLLLPYLDGLPLYRKYRFDEPWNGPNNSRLAESMPMPYGCLSDETRAGSPGATMTSYVAVIGPETAWPGQASVRESNFEDGATKTLFVVEVVNSGIHWMEPRDLDFREMAPTINSKTGKGISSRHKGGAWGLFCDGSVHFLSERLPAATVRASLTIRGHEKISIDP